MSPEPPTLAEKRKHWLKVLSGKDRHSIVRQLTGMTWNAAAYQVVNEARRLAPAAPDGGVQLNGMLHRLIDDGFFNSHMAAVRRLMDKYELKGERGVYSLVALLNDMKKHRTLLTRKALFDVEMRHYDYAPMKRRSQEFGRRKAAEGKQAYCVPRELCWEEDKRRHTDIDRLSGTMPADRKPEDAIREKVIDNLRAKAETACEQVVTYVTKFVAHSASPDSRASVQADDVKMTLDHLWKAHRSLCEVASFISIVILGDSCPGFLPIPQYDQFQYMQHPLVAEPDLPRLREMWRGFKREYHDWSQWTLKDYEREFGQEADGTA